MPKILLIEDQPQMRQNVALILELNGFEVVVAEDGKQGLMKARGEQPDLILCDVMMPELDGYDVLHRLRKVGVDAQCALHLPHREGGED